jgi:hypothetical protein
MYKIFLGLAFTAALSGAPAYAQSINDPTRPADYKTADAEQTDLVLGAILIAPQRRIAVINDQTVKVGDYVAGYQVVAIENAAVDLQRAPGDALTLHLLRDEVKTPVAQQQEVMQ